MHEPSPNSSFKPNIHTPLSFAITVGAVGLLSSAPSSELGMRHGIFPGNNGLDVPMWLTSCHINIILEL